MPLFIDTSHSDIVKKFHEMGVIRGATTNPTILRKEGLKGGDKEIKKRIMEIARLISPYPVSVEVTTNNPASMIKQAQEFASWADNINVKVPIHGPKGELDNLRIVHELETKHNIRVNVTAMMSAQQALLAALAGATYVSIFGGRVNNMGYNVVDEIKKLRSLIDSFGLQSKIIVGSTREVLNVIEWLHAGAHIVTVVPNILEGMIVHPYSKETVQQFLDDAAKGA